MIPLTTTRPTHDRAIANDPAGRLPGLAGVLSVVAMITAFMVVPADSGGTAPADIIQRYADGSDGYQRTTVLESLSMMFLIVLIAGLCELLRRRPGGELAATVVGLGGGVLAVCQLVGYGLIATLALGTAERGDEAVVMAVYDASSVAFVLSYVGLAVVCLGTAAVLIRGASGRRVAGGISLLVGTTAVVGASAYTAEGTLSPHGDLSFLILVLQLLWSATVSVSMLRQH
jgi:hypothetical protein